MQERDSCCCAAVRELYQMTGTQIADRLRAFAKRGTSDAEYESWRHSLPVLLEILHRAGLDELTLALEYETPLGSRIDAVLLGKKKDTGRPLACIIELKQWRCIGEHPKNMETVVSVCVSAKERRFEERLHPVQQTLTYRRHLQHNHSSVSARSVDVLCCQFLHNFADKQQLFTGNYAVYASRKAETYVKGEEKKLEDFFRKTFSSKPNQKAVALFLDGAYVFSTCDFRSLKRICENRENAAMIGEQAEVNKRVYRILQKAKVDTAYQALVVISGAPGTGKTVVGLHLLWLYRKISQAEQPYGAKCAFALPRSRTLSQVIDGASGIKPMQLGSIRSEMDLVVVDEAHRIESLEQTMHDLFSKAKIVVVLQDDRQRIRLSEEGTVERFKRFAERKGLHKEVYRLVTQKRAGYLGDYVAKLDQLLYDRCDAPMHRQNGVEVVCWESLQALDRHLHQLRRDKAHVKWYAPFCWAWSRNVKKKDIVIATEEGLFEKPWNPWNEQYRWYQGDAAESLEQVGCIYTAQGLEFDYTGVIWWDDLLWDESRADWRVNLHACQEREFVSSIVTFYGGTLTGQGPPWKVRGAAADLDVHDFLREKKADMDAVRDLVLNIYRVLLTRAKQGVHIWFKDSATARHFGKVMGPDKWQGKNTV